MISVELDQASLRQAQYDLSAIKGGIEKAFSRALNKSVTGAKTEMVELIRVDYNYSRAAILSRISTKGSTIKTLSAYVKSTGKSPNLASIVGTTQRVAGVSVNVKKATGRHIVKHTFLRTVGENRLVFQRARAGDRLVARYPLWAVKASHPEIIYNTKENWAKLSTAIQKRLDDNFAHEVDVVLKGIA